MEKYFTYPFNTKLFIGSTVKAIKIFFLALLLSCIGFESYATAWKTAIAGSIYTLSNWTNGSTSPTTFATPGDVWFIALPMTMSSGVPWNVGTMSMAPVTVNLVSGGSVQGSSGGFQLIMNIYGDINIADTIASNGGSCKLLMNIYGNCNVTAGSVDANGGGCFLTMNVNGNFSMTGGSVIASGGLANDTVNVRGNFSMSGPSFIASNGGSATGNVFLSLPTSSGTMLIDNTSTGTWVINNIFIDPGCTAQLDGNFSTNTGGGAYGLTVNGTLICPAAYTVNGSGKFILNSAATLEVASATGINGAITTTGIKTFSTSANYVFNGSVAQVTGSYLPAALVAPDTITISNSAGVTLSQTTATTGTLLFTSGILNTGTYTMSVPGAAASVTGAGLTSYVNGTLIKTISGLTAVNYEVGDLDYAPMALTLSSAGSGGSIGLKTTNGLHPSVGTSGLLSTNMANHYWTITNYGSSGPANIIPKATYNATDIIGGSNAAFLTQEYAGSAWLGAALATTNTSVPYTSAPNTGIALGTIAGDYIFGNVFCGTLPITGTTTLCAGSTTTLSDATAGGAWVSGAPAIATISGTGLVTGVAGGTATISYTVGTCTVTTTVSVNPLPNAGSITGSIRDTIVCVGKTDTLADAAGGGVWSSSNTSLATVGTSGIVTGVAAGIDTIVYTVTNGCGSATAKLRVRVLSTTACHTYAEYLTNVTMTELKIFPNPNEGAFIVNLLSAVADEEVQIVITNIVGEKVKTFATTTNKAVDIKLNEAPGIYLLSAATAQGMYNAKILVR